MNLARAIQLASYDAQYDCAQEALDADMPATHGVDSLVSANACWIAGSLIPFPGEIASRDTDWHHGLAIAIEAIAPRR